MNTTIVAQKLVSLFRETRFETAISELFATNIISIEPTTANLVNETLTTSVSTETTSSMNTVVTNTVSNNITEGVNVLVTEGITNVIAKYNNLTSLVSEFHNVWVSEPIIVDNFFSFTLKMDVTHTILGRTTIEELCVYNVVEGKIVREQLFFTPSNVLVPSEN